MRRARYIINLIVRDDMKVMVGTKKMLGPTHSGLSFISNVKRVVTYITTASSRV